MLLAVALQDPWCCWQIQQSRHCAMTTVLTRKPHLSPKQNHYMPPWKVNITIRMSLSLWDKAVMKTTDSVDNRFITRWDSLCSVSMCYWINQCGHELGCSIMPIKLKQHPHIFDACLQSISYHHLSIHNIERQVCTLVATEHWLKEMPCLLSHIPIEPFSRYGKNWRFSQGKR